MTATGTTVRSDIEGFRVTRSRRNVAWTGAGAAAAAPAGIAGVRMAAASKPAAATAIEAGFHAHVISLRRASS